MSGGDDALSLRVLELEAALHAKDLLAERAVAERTAELAEKKEALERALMELHDSHGTALVSQKLQSIGQLAAGVAHEINTPMQFIADNTTFTQRAWSRVSELLTRTGEVVRVSREGGDLGAAVDALAAAHARARVDYFLREVPEALSHALEGIQRVSTIVSAMKRFSHASRGEMACADVNECIETTAAISRNEWKYVADLELQLDRSLPQVPCVRDELNQVLLNLLVNAAHSISEVAEGEGGRGQIVVRTFAEGDFVCIEISDTGAGIPDAIRHRVFDPFFTTKPVGKGTGQGLAIARGVVVERHGGTLDFTSRPEGGTTFSVRLPFEAKREVWK